MLFRSSYDEKLGSVPQMVCVNKLDLLQDDGAIVAFEKKIGQKVYPISAIMRKGVDDLINDIFDKLEELPAAEPLEYEAFRYEVADKNAFHVSRTDDGAFYVEGGLIDQLARNVILSEYESFRYFQKCLKDKGVISSLRKHGAKEGDTVRIADIEFEFVE